ncbi:ABC transporter permease [Gordonibacter sp. An230]|uniref:FtsX-like permease family protein n=1 Tax=Gordonibacter sp. An230 TaxID=1965592 RepID=UPI000B39018B|nr:ABC transporter permease [Gordonibacter sp. An230]OUO90762.1 ABC transporter permease [Gordonibacter sp. An230]
MLARLAIRNVRRSMRDYAVYFVTLVFGVAAFYAFNSVKSQSVLFDLQGVASEDTFNLTAQFLQMFSVLIACVLGFLVIYANRFLIRRRKREFGTCLLLGMRPAQVSAIVLMETACVGTASLATGLALGLALSQGLSFLTAGLFSIPMQKYRFVVSGEAFVQTLLCFLLIFVVVALFNTLSLRRCKLVDLLSAAARVERSPVRGPLTGLVGFIVAAGLLAWAYVTLFESGLTEFGAEFWKATALMVVGTFLLFWSAAGFVVVVLERVPGAYFRGLAMFTTRQVASRVNTAFLSLSTVCVMLFFSLAVFSTGAGFVQVFSDGIEKGTLFDASLTANAYLAADDEGEKAVSVRERGEAYDWDVLRFLRDSVPNWDEFVEGAAQADLYQPREGTETYGELMGRLGVGLDGGLQEEALSSQTVGMVGLSQFNAVRALAGREPIDLSSGTYAVNNAVALSEDLSRAMAGEGVEIKVGGRMLSASGLYVEQPLSTSMFVTDGAMLVVPDEVVEALRAAGETPYVCYLDLSYRTDRAEGDRLLEEALARALPIEGQEGASGLDHATSPWPVTIVSTANETIEQSGGMRMMITYLALYIGFVFLITTAALLAIQQLSETSDSFSRYRTIAEIGCDRRMMFRSLLIQVAVYFLAPLSLAACHTACAVSVIGRDVLDQLGVSVSEAVFAAAAFTILVYGGYLLVTYFASRGLVRASLGKRLLG